MLHLRSKLSKERSKLEAIIEEYEPHETVELPLKEELNESRKGNRSV